MKIILLLLLFSSAFSRSTYSQVIDAWYNYNYDLKQIYSDEYGEYSFRAQVIEGDKMDFEILIAKGDTFAYGFNIIAYEFYYEPTIQNILNKETQYVAPVEAYKKSSDKKYNIYSYHYKAREGVKYLGIYIQYTQESFFTYSSIYFRLNVFKYKYSNIKDIKYNTEYELDTEIFTNNLIPENYQIYIRIPVESKDSMEIQLTTHAAYNKDTAFDIHVCQYKGKPSDSQVYYSNLCGTSLANTSDENKKFVYPFETDENIDYLSICIINTHKDLNYLYMYIFSEKGLAAAIIVLIVLLPILLIGGGAGFYVKRRRREKI